MRKQDACSTHQWLNRHMPLRHTALEQMANNAPDLHKPRANRSSLLINSMAFLLPLFAGLFIAFVLPHYGLANKFGGPGHDGYLELAQSLYQGTGFRFSADGPSIFHRPPLYPVLLLPFMGLPEAGIKFSIVLLNSLFLMTACIYTRRICKLLFPQAAIGAIAVTLLLCNPWIYRLVSSPLSAIMQMALYAALSFYFLQLCAKYRQYGQLPTRQLLPSFLKISILTTAMCLAHGTSVYVCATVLTVSALMMLIGREWKLLGLLLITATLTITALSPWAVRNQSILDRIEVSSSGAGFTYFLGNTYWDVNVGDYREDLGKELNALRMGGVSAPTEDMVSYWGVVDPATDNQLRDAMVNHLRENPTEIVRKSLLNLSDIYFPITHTLFCQSGAYSVYCAESLNPYQVANRAARSLLMLLIVGLALNFLRAGNPPNPALVWLAMAGALLHTLPYLPIATHAHHGIYSLGAMPLLCTLAAASLYRLRIKNALNTPSKNPNEVWGQTEHSTPGHHTQEIQHETQQALAKKRDENGVKVDHIIG